MKVMSNLILFVLSTRFPTEKAYGVTTEYTARAMNQITDFKIQVVTPIRDKNFATELKVSEVKVPLQYFFDSTFSNYINISKAIFNLKNMLYAIKLSIIFKKSKPIIWSRDILMSIVFRLFGFRIICEIHRTPSPPLRFLLRVLKKMTKVKFILISKHLISKLDLSEENSIVAGMSINENEITLKKFSTRKSNFTVGYIGLRHSSGNKLEIEQIIEAAAALETRGFKIKFKIIGFKINQYGFNLNLPKNVKFIERVPRSKIISKLDALNLGLVIYPNTSYFQDSFPIKIVEYASRKVAIIASDTIAHRRILGNNKALFFKVGSELDLAECILRLYEDEDLREELAKNAYNWVKQQTYQKRALKISKFIRNL
jgi:glycosyltransferase involved in cell wall biosynthesis